MKASAGASTMHITQLLHSLHSLHPQPSLKSSLIQQRDERPHPDIYIYNYIHLNIFVGYIAILFRRQV